MKCFNLIPLPDFSFEFHQVEMLMVELNQMNLSEYVGVTEKKLKQLELLFNLYTKSIFNYISLEVEWRKETS